MVTLDKDAVSSHTDYRAFWETELGEAIVKRSGVNLLCHSPFRQDKNPSFSVNVQSGVFNDFADESRRGDVFAFIMMRDGLSFPQAVEYVGRYAGAVPLRDVARPAPKPEQPAPETPGDPSLFTWIEYGPMKGDRQCKQVADYSRIDMYGRPDTVDFCTSALLHTEAIQKPGDNYRGAVRAPGIWFDIDADTIGDAQILAIGLFEQIVDVRCIDMDSLKIWFSGNLGFHFLLQSPGFSATTGTTDTPERMKAMALSLAGPVKIDTKIYDHRRYLRCPNTRHSKSRLFKIPIVARELYEDVQRIQKRALTQRNMADAIRETVARIGRVD